jgi:L-lactate dehydrogenase complex protein LldG
MSARDDILARLRERRSRSPDETDAATHLRTHAAGPVPQRAQGAGAELRARFVAAAEQASAEVAEIDGPGSVPALVARLCAEQGYAPEAVVAPDGALDTLDWGAAGLAVSARAAHGDDRVGVSQAFCGIAETGTLVLRSGPQSPVTVGFLPEVHVVALTLQDLVGGYEQAWQRLRAAGAMPRTVNWITGPSRSADIEQTIQIGAHGPLRLVIALY